MSNDHLILLSGKSATGKSASLVDLEDPEGVVYLNCENNKKLPFGNCKFKQFNITDPYQVYEAFTKFHDHNDVHTIAIDSITFLMDMFETMHVLTATNTMKAWGLYKEFFRKLMFENVAVTHKNIIMTAHTSDIYNEGELTTETLVKVKGSLMSLGIESFFSTVVSSKKMDVTKLNKYESDLLNITEEEKEIGVKYVYQTKLTKDTVNERIRSSMGMWSTKETFIDNNIQNVLNRLHTYYT